MVFFLSLARHVQASAVNPPPLILSQTPAARTSQNSPFAFRFHLPLLISFLILSFSPISDPLSQLPLFSQQLLPPTLPALGRHFSLVFFPFAVPLPLSYLALDFFLFVFDPLLPLSVVFYLSTPLRFNQFFRRPPKCCVVN